jgi:mannose/fructose/N-acetylgalactosamine-specific phosphotransferase system component IIB
MGYRFWRASNVAISEDRLTPPQITRSSQWQKSLQTSKIAIINDSFSADKISIHVRMANK